MERIKIAELNDKQLDELLAYTPGFTAQNSENIKRMFLQKVSEPAAKPVKRFAGKRILLAAAVAVLALATSITALAATGVIDIEDFYNRFFNSIFSNPEASPYVIASDGDTAVDIENSTSAAANTDGISDNTGSASISGFEIIGSGIDAPGSGGMLTVEPVAAFISQSDWERYFFDVFVKIKLTAEDKLHLPEPHAHGLYIHQKYTNEYGTHDVSLNTYGPTEIEYIDDYSAFVSFRTHAFADNITFDKAAKTISFNIHAFSPQWYLYIYPEIDDAGNETGNLLPLDEPYPITEGTTYYGDWKLTIDTDMSQTLETRWVDATFKGYEAKVRINATSVNVRLERKAADSADWPWVNDSNFKVTLADGRTVESPYVENSGDSMSTEYWGNIEFVIPADVVKVELFDEVVFDHTGE